MRTENVLYAPTVFKIPHCESRGFLYNEGEGIDFSYYDRN